MFARVKKSGRYESLQIIHNERVGGKVRQNVIATLGRLGPRTRKDLIEERLFARRRDLFSGIEPVFLDTTSIYFEGETSIYFKGEGGESLGQYGYSKGHRPDRKQIVVAAVLDERGRPICRELLPGNTADITTLIPVVDRLGERFQVRRVCIVADRGMIVLAQVDRRMTVS